MKKNFALPLVLLIILFCQSTLLSQNDLPSKKAFKSFLKEVKRDVESYNWERLIAKCDADHYHMQVNVNGIVQAQYIAEIFGLHSVGNNIKTGVIVTYEDLKRIKKLKWKKISIEDTLYKASGFVKLHDGTKLIISIMATYNNGEFALTGAIG